MSATQNIPAATGRALRYLASQQLPSGGFASYSSPALVPFVKKQTYNTVFTPAVMLGALAGLDEAAAVKIRGRLAAWLLEQKGPDWSFNYWAMDAPERATLPYPDDLDDTFCAAIGLHLHDESLLGGGALAASSRAYSSGKPPLSTIAAVPSGSDASASGLKNTISAPASASSSRFSG